MKNPAELLAELAKSASRSDDPAGSAVDLKNPFFLGSVVSLSGTDKVVVMPDSSAGGVQLPPMSVAGTTLPQVSDRVLCTILADGSMICLGSLGPFSLAAALSPATTVTNEQSALNVSPVVGTSLNYARQDHTHGTPATATPNAESIGASSYAGTANSVSPSDHIHGMPGGGVAGLSAPDDTASAGSSASFSRADHQHSREHQPTSPAAQHVHSNDYTINSLATTFADADTGVTIVLVEILDVIVDISFTLDGLGNSWSDGVDFALKKDGVIVNIWRFSLLVNFVQPIFFKYIDINVSAATHNYDLWVKSNYTGGVSLNWKMYGGVSAGSFKRIATARGISQA